MTAYTRGLYNLRDRVDCRARAKLCRWATSMHLLRGGGASRYDDSSYVGSKVLLQTESKSCRRPSWQQMWIR